MVLGSGCSLSSTPLRAGFTVALLINSLCFPGALSRFADNLISLFSPLLPLPLPSVGSTSSSPALLGIREPRSEYDRTQPPMQYYNSQGDTTHKGLYPGSSKPSPIYISSYSSPAREQNRRLQHQQLYYQDDSTRKTLDAYRLYLQSPRSYEDPYCDDRVHFPASTDYSTQYGLKSTTNYVDFYSTKRPSYRAEQYPGSPDSWV